MGIVEELLGALLFAIILGLYDRYYKTRLEKKYIRKVICQGVELILNPRKSAKDIVSGENFSVLPDVARSYHYEEMRMKVLSFLERRAFLLSPEDEDELRGVFGIFETFSAQLKKEKGEGSPSLLLYQKSLIDFLKDIEWLKLDKCKSKDGISPLHI